MDQYSENNGKAVDLKLEVERAHHHQPIYEKAYSAYRAILALIAENERQRELIKETGAVLRLWMDHSDHEMGRLKCMSRTRAALVDAETPHNIS